MAEALRIVVGQRLRRHRDFAPDAAAACADLAREVLRHGNVLTEQAAAIKLERSRLLRELGQAPGVTAYPSDANFILFRTREAERVFEGLKQRGVLIKSLHGSHRLLADCLRVTVGTPDENTAFLAALTRTLAA